jgi:hypothetical protein
MKLALLAYAVLFASFAYGDTPDITIPDSAIALIKTTDYVEVTGTNQLGGKEDFAIHDAKAIKQFVQLLTAERYNAVPKNLNPDFKSMSRYKVHLFSNGTPILDLQIIADSVIDLPNETSFYMESDRHSDILLAPLLRLR